MEPHEVDAIMRHLAGAIEHQRTVNEDLRTFIARQLEFNADVKTTLARLATLMARMIPPSANGDEG
jgi:hypothetical protein